MEVALTEAELVLIQNTQFFSILETKLGEIAKAFLYIPPPTATTETFL